MAEIALNQSSIEELKSRVETLANKKGISPTQALIQSGAGKNFFSNLIGAKKFPKGKILQIALFFNVTSEYLLGETDIIETKIAFNNTEKLTPKQRAMVQNLIDQLAEEENGETAT